MTGSPDGGGRWSVEADLGISIDDGVGATTEGRLTGTGTELVLMVDRPEVLLAATDRGPAGVLVSRLASAGVRAELRGPRGRVATVDPHRSSRAAGLLLGSPHLAVDRAGWGVLARAAASRSRHLAGFGPAVLLIAAAAIVTAVAWRPAAGRRGRTRRPAT